MCLLYYFLKSKEIINVVKYLLLVNDSNSNNNKFICVYFINKI